VIHHIQDNETFNRSQCIMLWRIEPLLGKDLETNNDTTAVAMQRRGKHASTPIELLLETAFSTRSVQRGYKKDNWGDTHVMATSPTGLGPKNDCAGEDQ
jgi:hypothetical protein